MPILQADNDMEEWIQSCTLTGEALSLIYLGHLPTLLTIYSDIVVNVKKEMEEGMILKDTTISLSPVWAEPSTKERLTSSIPEAVVVPPKSAPISNSTSERVSAREIPTNEEGEESQGNKKELNVMWNIEFGTRSSYLITSHVQPLKYDESEITIAIENLIGFEIHAKNPLLVEILEVPGENNGA
ncbi:unnamed protein product [Lactuca saligna]|uniref:Uncharacterized protein n=1 Tax=Lactuca saligna TaxID=75948 RepID=A0AA35VRY0_LACSI|nr:unnamed protein product [Lactuca saligna]